MKVVDQIETEKLKMLLRDDAVIEFHWKEGIEVEKEDIESLDQYVYQLVGQRKFMSLAIFPKNVMFGTGSHVQATQSEVNINMVAEAIVANDLAQKMILNWYSKAMEQSNIPIQLFKEKHEAEQWLSKIAIAKKVG